MQVAFQTPALFVLSLHEPLPRGTQLVETILQLCSEADVSQHQSRLVGEVVEQLLLGGRQRLAFALDDAQRSEQVTLEFHPYHGRRSGDVRQGTVRYFQWLDHHVRRRKGRCGSQSSRASEPDGR